MGPRLPVLQRQRVQDLDLDSDNTAERNTKQSTWYQLARGMWKHVTYTQTGSTGILYENGVEKARNTNVTTTPADIGNGVTAADYIGRSLNTSEKYFKGRMRDFRVHNRALAASEVQTIATGTEEQWAQLQAMASYNGALSAYNDPTFGPTILFPSDYTGDIYNLQTPPDFKDDLGNTPTSWPAFVPAMSQLFTIQQIAEGPRSFRTGTQ
ncbi:LamG-like jellyroll fold domain-containing protein [Streptomyces sp. NPDC051677]|uniref:LamG-like jellyroll fold domain-containing protein n=1 Tax=Streptomyces sp. NPDC051677 TaxID=3365669 RepID=UPI0037D67894